MNLAALSLVWIAALDAAAGTGTSSTPPLPLSRSYQSLVLSAPYPPTVFDCVPWSVDGVVLTDAEPELKAHSVPSVYELFSGCNQPGVFILKLTVTSAGVVTKPRIVRGPACPAAIKRILAAVSTWHYWPARKNGRTVAARITVTIAPGG